MTPVAIGAKAVEFPGATTSECPPTFDPNHIVSTYGYWAIAAVIGLESMGLPIPGETTLIAAATLAGATGDLNIVLVVAAAAGGAILGDSIGFWIGRLVGFRLLVRYGDRIRLSKPRLKLGQYLFLRQGAAIVFFGRFVALLRAFAALLAGANRMKWPRFLAFNAAGGVVWASLYGFGAYAFGEAVHRVAGPLGAALLVAGLAAAGAGFLFIRRHEARLTEMAERALPGPLTEPSAHPHR